MDDLGALVDRLAGETGFSGAVRVDHGDGTVFARAYGQAHRALGIANTVDTRFAIASGAKGFTALTVLSLIADGALELSTTARSVLGDDLPLIDDRVTIEQLLAHRSGIGDYLDESEDGDINDYVLDVPLHRLANAEDYLAVLGGYPTAFAPGERFAYCNGGYVVLAIVAGRISGVEYADLVEARVTEPAGLVATGFLRSDELPGDAALGYLGDGPRTNLLHLPVRGCGDGGIYATVADIARLWVALFAGRIIAPDLLAEAVRPRSDVPSEKMRYGWGFWLHPTSDLVILVGYDAGVSFRSVHDPATGRTHTVVANTSEGTWPITRALDDLLQW